MDAGPHPCKRNALLSIGGLDGTGGAGIHCDIKICSFLKIPNVTVITAIVLQSPFEVFQTEKIKQKTIEQQIHCLHKSFEMPVVNVGLIGFSEVLSFLTSEMKDAVIIFDPLFKSGSGTYVFKTEPDIQVLFDHLKNIYLITPNIPEANVMAQMEISSIAHMKEAAKTIQNLYSIPNILIKGGHIADKKSADLLLQGNEFFIFKSRLRDFNIHGTGSFLNAAISAYIFKGEPLASSVGRAKSLLKKSICRTNKDFPLLQI